MSVISHNKLVRDRIPEIIEKSGKTCIIRKLSDAEYILALEKKLHEEVAEYQKDKNLEELADVLEVLQAICLARGYSLAELESVRAQKSVERGGFKEKVFLEAVEDPTLPSVINMDCRAVGIDGCKGGWIVADIMHGKLEVSKFNSLEEIVSEIPFDTCVIDMVIGLQGKAADIRPDSFARHELKGRASTIFPAPCREAVYGETKEQRIESNVKILGKKFTSQTDAIIPKIREVDEFLQRNEKLKNTIEESHPEVCFARLNGSVLMSSKHTEEGIQDRSRILQKYIDGVSFEEMKALSSRIKCNMDDITDAVCLAIVANIKSLGKTETIPEHPMMDETGVLMQMRIPKKCH